MEPTQSDGVQSGGARSGGVFSDSMSRRQFVQGAARVAGGFAALKIAAIAGVDRALADLEVEPTPLGPLADDPAGVFDLPPGFRYVKFSEAGRPMDDGLLVPGKHDGMAAYAHPSDPDQCILLRNHEIEHAHLERGAISPFGKDGSRLDRIDRARLYDPGHGRTPAPGGVARVLFNTRDGRLERHELALAGTIRNCAGGLTPRATWITCEECVFLEDDLHEKRHGFNFEVPADPDAGLVKPVPLEAMGRFQHEAVCVDPDTGIVYQTEDRGDGLIYRFVPDKKEDLAAGGKLQALRVVDRQPADLRNWDERPADQPIVEVGQSLKCEWVDVGPVDNPMDEMRTRGYLDQGCARFARGEGMWWGDDAVWFACTNGGSKQLGQIWKYTPATQMLELFCEPNDSSLITNCDNICVAPWGDVIVCEDRDAGMHHHRLVAVRPDGSIYHLGRNRFNQSELAGACFSPDGKWMFVNVQTPGYTIAVTGPWEKLS